VFTTNLAETFYVPVEKLDQVRDVVSPEKWRPNRSAYELAVSWTRANGFPPSVKTLLDACQEFANAKVIRGTFEHGDDLGGPRGPSRTDLMLHVRCGDSLGMIAVEGKVDEGFDKTVGDWVRAPKDGRISGRPQRLEMLLRCLGISQSDVAGIRYQLIHRTASAVLEADRYHAHNAMMLVHAFTLGNPECNPARSEAQFDDFTAFAAILGISGIQRNAVSGPITAGSARLWLAWIDDAPC
jgi:hypothetical protein